MDIFTYVPEADESYVVDSRTANDFKSSTFTGYKKTDVKIVLLDCVKQGKVENACYWTAEMVCAGHFIDLWDILFLILGKYIHHGNPLMVPYYRKRLALFRVIMNEKAYYQSPLDLRNNIILRKIFTEMISTVTLSNKKASYEEVRIDENSMLHLSTLLKADRADYADIVMKKDDPRELCIAVNELCYHLSVTRNMNESCYWIEWILLFCTFCKKRGEPIYCEKRTEYEDIENKYARDVVWILWESILAVAGASFSLHTQTVPTLKSLFELFRVRYAGIATCKKRKYMLYFAVSLVTERVVYNTELVTEKNKEIVLVATENVNKIYKPLCMQERLDSSCHSKDAHLEQTYMAMEKKQNFNDSLNKLKKMSEIDVVKSD